MHACLMMGKKGIIQFRVSLREGKERKQLRTLMSIDRHLGDRLTADIVTKSSALMQPYMDGAPPPLFFSSSSSDC